MAREPGFKSHFSECAILLSITSRNTSGGSLTMNSIRWTIIGQASVQFVKREDYIVCSERSFGNRRLLIERVRRLGLGFFVCRTIFAQTARRDKRFL